MRRYWGWEDEKRECVLAVRGDEAVRVGGIVSPVVYERGESRIGLSKANSVKYHQQ
jgi:hypothetical protein